MERSLTVIQKPVRLLQESVFSPFDLASYQSRQNTSAGSLLLCCLSVAVIRYVTKPLTLFQAVPHFKQ